MIRNSQPLFAQNKLCQGNLISFIDKVAGPVLKGKSVVMLYLDFGIAFVVFIPHDILIRKLGKHSLD